MKREIAVKFKDVQRTGDKVSIDSPGLVQALVEHNKQAIEGLSKDLAPISAGDIRLDDKGRVQITNAKFAEALQAYPGGPAEYMSNCNCNGMSNYWCQ